MRVCTANRRGVRTEEHRQMETSLLLYTCTNQQAEKGMYTAPWHMLKYVRSALSRLRPCSQWELDKTNMWGHFYLLLLMAIAHSTLRSRCTAPRQAAMAHTMAPLSTTQNTNITLRAGPKSPALKNCNNLSLGAKCDTRRSVKYIQFVLSSECVHFFFNY